MPVTKELTVFIDDRPGALGKVCRALAHPNVNILALHVFSIGGKSVARFVVDNPTAAKSVLDSEKVMYAETQVVQLTLPHKPGELARIASRLGEAKINIDYAYCGLEPYANAALLFLGVAEASEAAPILEQVAAPAGRS